MQIYLVGGAVRDYLLGRPVKEKDWVVVGATPQEMLAQGFKPVGKDFPVFLHPKTGEEYALARTERKIAPGHTGFTFHAAPHVTLEEDLYRRDLTINAIAQTIDGQIIDPYGGQADLARRLLRHVSSAFVEDPLRVLRVARFMARLGNLGFTIAPETLQLMETISLSGELATLSPERVWQELVRALSEPQPHLFFTTLESCGALSCLFPELAQLRGVPANPKSHPEIDSWEHTLLVMQQITLLTKEPIARFAALVHDLGKALTPIDQWPSHADHALKGTPLVHALCQRYKVPRAFQEFALLATRYHLAGHKVLEMSAAELVSLLNHLDLFRRPHRLEWFLVVCQADSQGRIGYEKHPYPQADFLRQAYQTAAAVSVQPLLQQGLTGAAINQALNKQRVKAVATLVSGQRGLA